MAGMQLYIKGSNVEQGGDKYGDCPFSMRAMLMCAAKGIQPEIIPVDFKNKPDIFKQINPSGKVPLLVDGDRVVSDSGDIVSYLEERFPQPAMEISRTDYTAASGKIFGALVSYAKAEPANEDTAKSVLVEELKKFNDYLASRCPDGFICGSAPSAADFEIAPKLLHVTEVGRHYKGFEIPQEFTALHCYMQHVKEQAIFKQCAPSKEEIIAGWKKHFTS